MAAKFDTSDFEPIATQPFNPNTFTGIPANGSNFDTSDFEPINSVPAQSLSQTLMSTLQGLPQAAGTVPLDFLSGIANGTRNLLNLPFGLSGSNYQLPQTGDLSQMVGLRQGQPDAVSSAIQMGGQFVPAMLGSQAAAPTGALESLLPFLTRSASEGTMPASATGFLPSLARSATEGAVTGAAQNPADPMTGLEYAGANVAFPLAAGGLNSVGTTLASRYGLPAYTSNLMDKINALRGFDAGNAYNVGSQNYKVAKDAQTQKWNNLNSAIQTADSTVTPPGGLDTSYYTNPIADKINKLTQQGANHSAYADANAEPINLLKNYLNDKVDTFQDAITQSKALNKAYKNTVRPTSGVPKSTDELAATNTAIGALHDMLNNNITNLGLQDTLGAPLEAARQSTRDFQQIFNQVPDVGGDQKMSILGRNQITNNPFADPTTFVSNYVPKTKASGTQSMQQFGKVIGDDDLANKFMKREIFNDALKTGTPDPQVFMNKYNNLSDDQQAYLFSPEEQEQIGLIDSLRKKYPTEVPDFKASLGHAGGAGAIVGAISHMIGLPFDVGAGIGAAPSIMNQVLYGIGGAKPINQKAMQFLMNQKGGYQAPNFLSTALAAGGVGQAIPGGNQ